MAEQLRLEEELEVSGGGMERGLQALRGRVWGGGGRAGTKGCCTGMHAATPKGCCMHFHMTT